MFIVKEDFVNSKNLNIENMMTYTVIEIYLDLKILELCTRFLKRFITRFQFEKDDIKKFYLFFYFTHVYKKHKDNNKDKFKYLAIPKIYS